MKPALPRYPRWLFAAAALLTGIAAVAQDQAQSMFSEQTYRSLVAETKAVRVGDLLTVVVQESATASSSADSRGQRDFAVSAQLDAPRLGSHSAKGGFASEGENSGRTQRSGRLLAQLTVRVLEVAPNGDLIVSGQQSLQINGEEQLITLSGVVRPRDIAENNTVLSSRIAQARIQFDGEGFVAERSQPGWIARLVSLLGL